MYGTTDDPFGGASDSPNPFRRPDIRSIPRSPRHVMSPSLLGNEGGSPSLSHTNSGIYDYRNLGVNGDITSNSIDASGLTPRRASDEVRFAREVAQLQEQDFGPEQASATCPCCAKGGCCYPSVRCGMIAGVSTTLALIAIILSVWLGAPRIGDDAVAATTLKFLQVNISNPDADSFQLDSLIEISGLKPVSARMHAFDATLLYNGKAMATTRLPAMEVKANKVNVLPSSARAKVTDVTVFNQFNEAILQNEEVEMGVKGKLSITTRAKHLRNVVIKGLHLDKTATLRGSAGLRGAQVRAISMADSTPEHLRVALAVEVNNPSTVSIAGLGTMCLDVYYRGEKMGRMSSLNTSLPRGNSTLHVSGELVAGNMTDTDDLISRFLDGLSTTVQNRGIMCQGASPLFGPAASTLNLQIQFPGNPTPLVDGLIVDGLSMMPKEDGSVDMQLNATVTVNSPLGPNAPIVVEDIAMDAELMGAGMDVGQLHVPKTKVPGGGKVSFGVVPGGYRPARQVHWNRGDALAVATGSGPPVPPTVKQNVTLALQSTLNLASHGYAMGDFVSEFIRSDEVDVALVGSDDQAMRVTLTSALGPLHLHVPVTARSKLPGMRNFPEVLVSDFNLLGPTPDGKGLIASNLVTLLNPSPVEVRMGDRVQFGIYSAESGRRMGSMVAFHTDLPPGLSVLNMSGVIEPAPGGLQDMSQLFSNYLTGKDTKVAVRGENVTFGGGIDTPSWLMKAVRNISMSTVMPGAKNLTLTTGLGLTDLNMSFVPPKGAPPHPDPSTFVPLSSSTVHGTVHVPFSDVPMDILEMNVTFEYCNLETGEPFARVRGVHQKCDYKPFAKPGPGTAAGTIDIFLTPAYLEVVNEELMKDFVAQIVLTPAAHMLMRSNASQLIKVPVGELVISGIQLEQEVIVPGLDGFSDPPILVLDQDIVGSTNTTILAVSDLEIRNPSIINGLFTTVTLDMMYLGEKVAEQILPAFDLLHGVNHLNAQTILIPPPDDPEHKAQHEAFRGFVSSYLVGNSTHVELKGFAESTPVPLLSKAYDGFHTFVSIPGSKTPLVVNATLDVLEWKDGDVLGQVFMANPTGVEIYVIDSKLYIYGCSDELKNTTCLEFDYSAPIGLFSDKSFKDAPVVIPPHTTRLTPEKPFRLLGDQGARLIQQLIDDGAANTAISGNFTMLQGQVEINVEYAEENILTYAKLA